MRCKRIPFVRLCELPHVPWKSSWDGLEVRALVLITGLEAQTHEQPLPTPHAQCKPTVLKHLHFHKLFLGGPTEVKALLLQNTEKFILPLLGYVLIIAGPRFSHKREIDSTGWAIIEEPQPAQLCTLHSTHYSGLQHIHLFHGCIRKPGARAIQWHAWIGTQPGRGVLICWGRLTILHCI